ncbi:hypothetical protein C0992_000991 [Termitomyces sp. T32_za158]|nr:hypothetical protein C0992_000991 [Termitomyces sp. T32_za158]
MTLQDKWNSMSNKEKIALTDPLIAELKEHRANVTYGQHNTDLGSFSDATQSLLKIEQYMCALHARTGMEMYFVACRSSADGLLHPFATFTSERVCKFAYHQHKMLFQDMSLAFEAYCLAGVEGMINKQTSTTAKLKTKLKNLINLSLEALLGKVRMVYVGFKEKFTIPYGIVPLKRFIPLSELTRPEVDILLNAWTSSTTYFHKMNIDEWEKWHKNYMTSESLSSSFSDGTRTPDVNGSSSDDSMMYDQLTSTSTSPSESQQPVQQPATTHMSDSSLPNPSLQQSTSITNSAASTSFQFINALG